MAPASSNEGVISYLFVVALGIASLGREMLSPLKKILLDFGKSGKISVYKCNDNIYTTSSCPDIKQDVKNL